MATKNPLFSVVFCLVFSREQPVDERACPEIPPSTLPLHSMESSSPIAERADAGQEPLSDPSIFAGSPDTVHPKAERSCLETAGSSIDAQ